MSGIESTICPGCGAQLLIAKEHQKALCDYCGNTFTVRIGGGLSRLDTPDQEDREQLIKEERYLAVKSEINQIRSEMEEIRCDYLEKEQRILQKHRMGDGLSVSALTAMAVLMKFKDKKNSTLLFDLDKFCARFEALSDEDLNFLLNEVQKYAVDPKIYEKPAAVAFSEDLLAIKKLREERDQKLSVMKIGMAELINGEDE